MELQEAIIKRRSIRKFTDYRVSDEEILKLLEAARMAPSWANTQVWEFIVVRDKGIMEQLTGTYSETNPARKCSLAATAMIVGCAMKGVSGYKEGKTTTKFNEWFMFDMGLAVQNIWLKAHEIGLGTVVVGLFDHDKCKGILSLPDEYEVTVILPLGQPETAGKDGPPRKELGKFVHADTFGNNYIK